MIKTARLIGPTLRGHKRKRYADGGGDLSDADQAAMMPETYVNPVAKAAISGIGDTIAGPGRVAAPNPYPPGSEEASWYEDQRDELAGNWGPSTALSMIRSGIGHAEPGALGSSGGRPPNAAWRALRKEVTEQRAAAKALQDTLQAPAPEHVDPFEGMNEEETADAFEKMLRTSAPKAGGGAAPIRPSTVSPGCEYCSISR